MVNQQTIGERARGTALSAADLAALRDSLNEQRLFRREQIQQLTATAVPRTEAPLDRRAAAQTEVRVQLAASARMVLADVEAALERMDQGRYGRCHLCHGPIDRGLLTIVPQARSCARCRHLREAGR
ncbi:hypothetical protein [Streptomyces sp. VNUA24]|uniref:TraR/DksA family transcriptional regulator n=1 Tax=Streptomyces sp. VNUA24 TaxID=3031131 RepID=UPI0023B7AFC4|nr:hypothetical protein [Streptomyces sp. VNUA24]WEH13659.1 hypothetical protein PYR72_08075 [Streptomyces sp. VNUA24]